MFAVVAIVAVQLLFAALLFGTLLLDRGDDQPRMAELRRRVR
jgi:hypothetical protein